ncbi:acyltransferase domain-containing protein [Nocardia sp. NPDC051030]|uniref:acyltransferase domain-containing protein n=1 Tax=Nocardia sp. NPDC051030 TaxID=3155162 RepID=UPI00341BC53A
MAIVGVGCRATGTDFDYDWFGISPLEAAGMSPRQRVNLEVAVEALDDSGLGCLARGSNAAVVFGAGGATNSAHQLSRALDLRGPSLTVDSERASPLVAVDMGVRLLADPTVPFVIAGGVDLTLLPDISDLQTPTPGSTDPLCTVLILQRTPDALRTRTRRYAEIAGAGLGFPETGTPLAHITLHDDPGGPNGAARPTHSEDPPVLIPITGRDPSAVHDLALRWAAAVASYRTLGEFASATARLVPEPTRATILARDPAEAATQLRALARHIAAATPTSSRVPKRATTASEPTPHPAPRAGVPQHGSRAAGADIAVRPGTLRSRASGAVQSIRYVGDPARAADGMIGLGAGAGDGGVLFLFSGGGGHSKMGRALAARHRVFARAVVEAADVVADAGGPRVWTPRYGFGNGGDAAEFAQPALFVFQVAMAELLGSWGVRADAVAGYGIGEIAAAAVSGALSMQDAARIVVARGRLLAGVGTGAAAAILEATPAEVARLVEPMRAEVGVAGIDGPSSITVTGESRYIDILVRRAHRRAIFAQRIGEGAAGNEPGQVPHIPRMRTLAPRLNAELGEIIAQTPECAIYSTTRRGVVITGPAARAADDRAQSAGSGEAGGSAIAGSVRLDADYWVANAAGPVELAAALEQAAADGFSTVLEIGPQPVSIGAVRECAAFRDAAYPVGSRVDEAAAFLRALSALYSDGRELDWTAAGAHTASPPQRHWRRAASAHEGGAPSGESAGTTPLFPTVQIQSESTYVVAGGLGVQGAVAVRWLLDAGAGDVVVLTRTPRALPPPLDGMEDRIILVRCDARDRVDLAAALQDIRECGPPIRGIVHAACAPPLVAAVNLLELTAADPTDFTVLLTDPVPSANQWLAHAAVRELAATHPDRQVVCVDWETDPAA